MPTLHPEPAESGNLLRTSRNLSINVIRTVRVLTINISPKICALLYTIYDVYELHVSAPRYHPYGVTGTEVYKPTCQYIYLSN